MGKKRKHHFIHSLILLGTAITGSYTVMKEVASKQTEPKNIDEENPYLHERGLRDN